MLQDSSQKAREIKNHIGQKYWTKISDKRSSEYRNETLAKYYFMYIYLNIYWCNTKIL